MPGYFRYDRAAIGPRIMTGSGNRDAKGQALRGERDSMACRTRREAGLRPELCTATENQDRTARCRDRPQRAAARLPGEIM